MAPRPGAESTSPPTWTGGSPAIGDGTLTGRYIALGSLCFFRIYLVAGSSTTFGSGGWSFTLPTGFTSSATSRQVVVAQVLDSGTSIRWSGAGVVTESATTIAAINVADGGTAVSSSAPMTWAAGDSLVLEGWLVGTWA